MRISKLVSLLFAAFLLVGLAARAEASQIRYEGMHPVPSEYGGGFCEIDFPHVHVFEPQRPDVLYRSHDHGYAFVGDPVPYGYQGPKHAYYGPHPMQDEVGDVEYCYLEGPHYHSLPPAPTTVASFKLKGGVYFYGGRFPQTYYEARPRYARINVIYKPLEYARPVVVAPEGEAVVSVSGPQAVVAVQPPTVVGGVNVQAGIGVQAGFMVGAPPPPMVVVGGPPSVMVVERHEPRTVFIEERRHPRTVYVEERRPRTVVVREHDHHDHGRDHDDRVEVVKVKEKRGPERGKAWGRGW
jgi:hypothetical protein